MGKRGKQYNRKVILELVEKWLPVTMDDWGALVPLYKVMANEEEERTPLSLSVAYQAMAKVQNPTQAPKLLRIMKMRTFSLLSTRPNHRSRLKPRFLRNQERTYTLSPKSLNVRLVSVSCFMVTALRKDVPIPTTLQILLQPTCTMQNLCKTPSIDQEDQSFARGTLD
jgi:hypothetical protein